ncbi:GTP pyrophosphokinase family protein [Actinotalea sp.]|uniref:GTP pyrophosphokinase n=1 Tax=Actinotalea sp. TaxID=1872145 RepID=UPI003567C47C
MTGTESPIGLANREGIDALEGLTTSAFDDLERLRAEFTRFMLQYKFGIDEVTTKISILQEEFAHLHAYNPIEHVSSRLKTPESLVAKVVRRGIEPSFDAIREQITDIAGIRVTCSFTSDVYRIAELLGRQADLTVLEVKDYISAPKPNGYRSLHTLVQVPVFLSQGPVPVTVEVQIRTIAMDFWASLEHKIFYKYAGEAPPDVATSLTEAAETAHQLDTMMEQLHQRVHGEGATARGTASGLEPDDRLLERLRAIREHGA